MALSLCDAKGMSTLRRHSDGSPACYQVFTHCTAEGLPTVVDSRRAARGLIAIATSSRVPQRSMVTVADKPSPHSHVRGAYELPANQV